MRRSVRTSFPFAYLKDIYTTPLERQCLDAICFNEMNSANGGLPISYWDTQTWTNMILDGAEHSNDIKPTSLPGVMASLIKKGLVRTDGEVSFLSPLGYAYFVETIVKRPMKSPLLEGLDVLLPKEG